MFFRNVKMALASLGATKVRSFLTMFGVIIGVSSVLIAVGVGVGIKNQVVDQIGQLGDDVITVIPGKSFVTNSEGDIVDFNSNALQGSSTITEKDVEDVKKIDGVLAVTPDNYVGGIATSVENPEYSRATIIATTPDVTKVLSKKIATGEFFNEDDNQKARRVVTIGNSVANDLFNQPDPIGRVLTIRGENFIVRGVLETATESPINVGFNSNYAIYMPLNTGKEISGGNLQINQMNIKIATGVKSADIANTVNSVMLANHKNQEDFTVIQQEDFLQATDKIFSLLTTFVASVAAISLFVGGVGIMNIMLVSVSERTREIGIRKAVGATNRQIITQFLVEAVVISIMGGIIGIILSFVTAYFIRIYSPIVPALSLSLVALAFGVSVAVGVIFGITPAIKAATKDPIKSLRRT